MSGPMNESEKRPFGKVPPALGKAFSDLSIVKDLHAVRCGLHGFCPDHQGAGSHSPSSLGGTRHRTVVPCARAMVSTLTEYSQHAIEVDPEFRTRGLVGIRAALSW